MSKHPDVMMLGGSAVPGALPNIALTQRGYKGQIYNNHGWSAPTTSASAARRWRAASRRPARWSSMTSCPMSNPIKPVATKFMTEYHREVRPGEPQPFRRLQR